MGCLLFGAFISLDAPTNFQFYFQDVGTPIFEGLSELHDTMPYFRTLLDLNISNLSDIECIVQSGIMNCIK